MLTVICLHLQGGRTVGGMPVIEPLKFAKDQLRKERELYEQIAQKAKKNQSKYEMLPADPAVKDKLYDGFTREGKGRYQYLRERSEILPELRYTFPITSSAKYGWKIGEEAQLQKPRFARSRVVRDTFYTRNGVPDLRSYGQRYTTMEGGLTFS